MDTSASAHSFQANSSETERGLIDACRQGDPEATRRLYEQHKDRVYNLALNMLGDAEMARDAVQFAFIKAFRGLDTFRGEARFASWLYRLTLNQCRDLQRQRRRDRPLVPLEDVQGTVHEREGSLSLEEQRAQQQTRVTVQRAMLELKPQFRSVILLRFFEELSIEEIAETLHCSIGTVASRLNRGLKKLEKKLKSPVMRV